MAYNLNLQEKIDRFLEGEMEAAERTAFEQEIHTDPEVRELVQLHQGLAETLADQQESQLIAALHKVRAERNRITNTQTGKVVSFQARLLRWAAVAILLLTVGIGYRYFLKPSTPETLFAANFEGAQMQLTEMSTDSDALLQSGIEHYNRQDYAAAALSLQAYLQSEPEHWEVQIYLGNALLQSGQVAEARIIYQKVANSGSSYKDIADWQYALSFLKTNAVDSTKNALQQIADRSDHSYQQKAKTLLRRLK